MIELKDIECFDDVERLILLRRRLGFKQYQLARSIGISRRKLVMIENYQSPISKQVRQKIDELICHMIESGGYDVY